MIKDVDFHFISKESLRLVFKISNLGIYAPERGGREGWDNPFKSSWQYNASEASLMYDIMLNILCEEHPKLYEFYQREIQFSYDLYEIDMRSDPTNRDAVRLDANNTHTDDITLFTFNIKAKKLDKLYSRLMYLINRL